VCVCVCVCVCVGEGGLINISWLYNRGGRGIIRGIINHIII
jgi:hypothetical protein